MKIKYVKQLIKKYLHEDISDDDIITNKITAYVFDKIIDGQCTYGMISTNFVIILDCETIIFEADDHLWYMGCFVGENARWFMRNDIEKIFQSGNLVNDIKHKINIHAVLGYECYETLEELLLGF